jgi:hypothetical protein
MVHPERALRERSNTTKHSPLPTRCHEIVLDNTSTMQDTKHDHNPHGRPSADTTNEAHRPYWKRAHHDWRFWLVLVLMIVAMVVYIVSEDLSMGTRNTQHQPVPENVTP